VKEAEKEPVSGEKDRLSHNQCIQMKRLLLILLLPFLLVHCRSTKVYIVRHAEKGTMPANDPDLTAAGRARAQSLAAYLRKKEIKAIYSTQTKRTLQTAEPLSLQTGVPVSTYSNDTLPKFLFRVLDAEKNTLIVGHSNTVLKMVQDLSLRTSIKEIPDNDYDNLFIIILKSKDGPGGYELRLKERTYGKKSPNTKDTARQATMMQ
jgi:broad specificity phosphatase PhoE